MNSINSISKYKYTSKNEYPVNLEEYVYIVDKASDEKYLLLKFFNTLSEIAHHLECNIKLFNENNFMIENIDFNFDGDFEQGYFVPEMKLKINSKFSGLKIEIKKIVFDTLYYEKGRLEKIPVVLTDEDEEVVETTSNNKVTKKTKWQKKKDKLDYVSTKRNIGLINKKKYVVRADRVNKTKLAIVLTSIFSILFIAYYVTTMLLFSINAKLLYDGSLYYVKESDKLTVVEAKEGLSNVVIPEKLDGYQVTKIDDNVFKDMESIQKVTFNGDIIIGKNAFSGCTNLKTLVNSSRVQIIYDYAFQGTAITDFTNFSNLYYLGKEAFPEASVSELYFPKLSLKNQSLANFSNVTKLTYYDLADGVGLANVLSEKSINTLKTIVTYDSVEDYELLNTTVTDVTLLSNSAKITSDRLINGNITRLSVPMQSTKLSAVTGISKNTSKPLKFVEVNKILSFNADYFGDISVTNIAINPTNSLTNTNVSSINPSTATKTIFISGRVSISDMDNYLKKLSTNYPSLTTIYFEGNVPNYTYKTGINLVGNYNYNNYVTLAKK